MIMRITLTTANPCTSAHTAPLKGRHATPSAPYTIGQCDARMHLTPVRLRRGVLKGGLVDEERGIRRCVHQGVAWPRVAAAAPASRICWHTALILCAACDAEACLCQHLMGPHVAAAERGDKHTVSGGINHGPALTAGAAAATVLLSDCQTAESREKRSQLRFSMLCRSSACTSTCTRLGPIESRSARLCSPKTCCTPDGQLPADAPMQHHAKRGAIYPSINLNL